MKSWDDPFAKLPEPLEEKKAVLTPFLAPEAIDVKPINPEDK